MAVDAFLDGVKDACAHGGGIELWGFGPIKVRRRNTWTGEHLRFRPGLLCRFSNPRVSSSTDLPRLRAARGSSGS